MRTLTCGYLAIRRFAEQSWLIKHVDMGYQIVRAIELDGKPSG
jgi:hypothetical protein